MPKPDTSPVVSLTATVFATQDELREAESRLRMRGLLGEVSAVEKIVYRVLKANGWIQTEERT